MRIETLRNSKRLILIAENKKESALIDAIFGKNVGEEGLIAKVKGEVRLSTDCRDHYIVLEAEK